MILTSSLGSGHVVAAQAIEQALRACAPDTRVHTVDFWTLMDSQVAQTVRQAYLGVLEHEPDLYDRVYRLDQRLWRRYFERDQPVPEALATLMARLDHFARVPDDRATLAAQFGGEPHLSDRMLFRQLCNSLMNAGPGSRGNHPRLRLMLTRWIWARLAGRLEARMLMFEPDAMVATQMGPAALAASIKTRRGLTIPLIGVSTDFGVHDFWAQPGIDACCVGHETIVPPADHLRLYATGIPLQPAFRQPQSQRSARRALGLDPERPVVLVQGGGLTVAEVLACGRPLIATRAAGGQEGFNLRFLGNHGVGWLLADRALIPWVRTLLADATKLSRLQQHAWSLGRRDGARQIAGLVIEMTRQRQRKPAFATP